MKISEWIRGENCSFRIRSEGDPEKITDRVAFIEKTPRVRIRPDFGPYDRHPDWPNWAEGYKGNGPDDEISKAWCDAVLPFFGYELP